MAGGEGEKGPELFTMALEMEESPKILLKSLIDFLTQQSEMKLK